VDNFDLFKTQLTDLKMNEKNEKVHKLLVDLKI